MLKIDTLTGHERMFTQDLLLAVEKAVQEGETEFEIIASGQHDIGGPLWHPEGKKLVFHVTNPGQRVGSMCLDNTEIVVDGRIYNSPSEGKERPISYALGAEPLKGR